MCRLLAIHASSPQHLAPWLVQRANSLVQQSCRDSEGESHGDGWGIGYYEGGRAKVFRQPSAAYNDPQFALVASSVQSPLAMAHVRQASVGSLSTVNTHPFQFQNWMFAHNGTVAGFETVGPRLRAEVPPELLAHVQGQTDSELIFFWILARIQFLGLSLDEPAPDVAPLMSIMARAVVDLSALAAEADPTEPTRLNFVLSDGRNLVASRWRHSLYWLQSEPRLPQLESSTADAPIAQRASAHLIVVASEPVGVDAWKEMPDASILAVNGSGTARIHSL